MKLTFYGAAGEVTGSQHLIETKHRRILLDCGLFQGRRLEARLKNEKFHCRPADLDAVILSHAHIDHCGNLPSLYKQGFRGPVFCTPATEDVAQIMLMDSANIQQEDVRYLARHLEPGHPPIEPLYDQTHVQGLMKLVESIPYGQWHELGADIRLRLSDAGHILGSSIVELDIDDDGIWKRLVFTGDLGRRGLPLLRDPQRVEGCDILITEGTYGNRVHPTTDDLANNLERVLQSALNRGGRVLIPAFSLGRTQTLVFFLNRLHNAGRLPPMQVFVDSPLSREITSVYRRHRAELDAEFQQCLQNDEDPFTFPGLRFTAGQQESVALNRRQGMFTVIAAGGMCENGRIVHHLKHGLDDDRNTVLIIGFQAEHTLGRKLQDGHKTVRIFDRTIQVRAHIESVAGLSAHADANDFKWWYEGLAQDRGVGQAFIVHAEPDAARGVAGLLRDVSDEPPIIPQFGQSFDV